MGGAAGDQVEHALLLQAPEARDQGPLDLNPLLHHRIELAGQVGGCLAELLRRLLQQLLALCDPGQEARVEGAVGQQRQQGGREAEGEPGVLAPVGRGGLEHGQQRQVALLQRLEIPVLLQRSGLARAHVGQMRVEDEGQIACGHDLPAVVAL